MEPAHPTRRPTRSARQHRLHAGAFLMVAFAITVLPLNREYRAGNLEMVLMLGGMMLGQVLAAVWLIATAGRDREDEPVKIPADFAFILQTTRTAGRAKLEELDGLVELMCQQSDAYDDAFNKVDGLMGAAYRTGALDPMVELDRLSFGAAAVGALMLVGDDPSVTPDDFGALVAPWLEAGLPLMLGGTVFMADELGELPALDAVDMDAFIAHIQQRAAAGLTRVPAAD